jgi:hypothetical protein
VPSPPVCAVWASRPRSSTVAPLMGASAPALPALSSVVTFTVPPGRSLSTTGSLVAVSLAVTGPPTPVGARATSVYGRPTSLSKPKLPSASVVVCRDGLVDTTTVAPSTGLSSAPSTRPSSRSSPAGSSSMRICASPPRSGPGRSPRSGPGRADPLPVPVPALTVGLAAGLSSGLRSAKNHTATSATKTAAIAASRRGFIGAHYDRRRAGVCTALAPGARWKAGVSLDAALPWTRSRSRHGRPVVLVPASRSR